LNIGCGRYQFKLLSVREKEQKYSFKRPLDLGYTIEK